MNVTMWECHSDCLPYWADQSDLTRKERYSVSDRWKRLRAEEETQLGPSKRSDKSGWCGSTCLVHMLLIEILIDTEYLICSLPISPVFRLPLPSSNTHLNLIFKNDHLIKLLKVILENLKMNTNFSDDKDVVTFIVFSKLSCEIHKTGNFIF